MHSDGFAELQEALEAVVFIIFEPQAPAEAP